MADTKIFTKKDRIMGVAQRIAQLEQDLAAIDAKDVLGVKRRAELIDVMTKHMSGVEVGELAAQLEQMDKDVLRAEGQDKDALELLAYSRKEQARRSTGPKNRAYGFLNEIVAMVTQVRIRITVERDNLLKELKSLQK